MASGGRRQFAALYPNSDEPGHRLNSRLRARLTEFACIDQQPRNLPVCTVEFEKKSDECLFFLFTTFNFRLPASSRMVATSSLYWVNHDGRRLHSVLWRSVRQRAAYAREATSRHVISQASGYTLASTHNDRIASARGCCRRLGSGTQQAAHRARDGHFARHVDRTRGCCVRDSGPARTLAREPPENPHRNQSERLADNSRSCRIP